MSPESFMHAALRESYIALPDCLPNPPVGCVIVRDGRVIGRGYTNPPGAPHAEAMALRSLDEPAAGAIVYVTLEPCSFDGRTPSCAAALVAAGVAEVHVGLIDPDPRNQGKGIEMLRAAGILVHLGTLGEAVKAFLDPYLAQDEDDGHEPFPEE